MKLSKNLHWFICLLFAASCARQTSPTGGPKDTIPPVLIKAIPENESINFRAKEIELLFTETVNLNNPKEQLIITPTIGKEYKIIARKNAVKIEFEEPLRDSTTYTFNFRDAVQDITERNPVRNLSLAYSTGDYIDSLSIEGEVHDLLKAKELKDITVALHPENDTFNIFLHPANYFTKTDEQGRFKISHLKPGNYFVYAFEDKNRNLIVNSRSESYGFLSEHQQLTDTLAPISLGLIRLDAGPLRITSARPYNTYFNIRATKNLRTFSVSAPDSTTTLSYTFGEDQANIRIYDTTDKDSIQVRLIAMDSINNLIDTTLYAKFQPRQATPEKFEVRINSSSLMAHTGELTATIKLTKPLGTITYDSIYFQVDSLTRIPFTPQDILWDPLNKTIQLKKRLDQTLFSSIVPPPQGRRSNRLQRSAQPTTKDTASNQLQLLNEFHIRKAAFISVESDSSAAGLTTITPMKPEELATIHFTVKTQEPSYYLELVDNNFKIIQQIRNQSKVTFRDIVPGEYQIRLVIDRNDNGRWDPGNYFKFEEPEPIIYYRAADGATKIKGVNANWEIGTDDEMFITY